MTDTTPTADWHAQKAVDLTSLAQSASMAGWWRRGRRRELLAAAQVHAILGASGVPQARHVERLHRAEAEAEAAAARADALTDQLGEVEQALTGYGQDLLAGRTPGEAVEALMGHAFNDEPLGSPARVARPQCTVCGDKPGPGSYCAECGRQG